MRQLKILNSKEKEKLLEILHSKYGIDSRQFNNLAFMEDQEEIWVSCKQTLQQDYSGFNIDSLGLLLARKNPLELTVNAVQIFCNQATENTLTLERNQAKEFIEGKQLSIQQKEGVYILKNLGRALDLAEVKNSMLKRKSKK